jgi:hypothetical protein
VPNGSSRKAQDFIRAGFDQNLAESLPCPGGVIWRTALRAANALAAIGGKNGGFNPEFAVG